MNSQLLEAIKTVKANRAIDGTSMLANTYNKGWHDGLTEAINLVENVPIGTDALEAAKKQMEHAEQMDGEYAGPALQWVNAYAAIATAEAATRQAAALERIANVLCYAEGEEGYSKSIIGALDSVANWAANHT